MFYVMKVIKHVTYSIYSKNYYIIFNTYMGNNVKLTWVTRCKKWTPLRFKAKICWSPPRFTAKKLDPNSGHLLSISNSWALACMLWRPWTAGQFDCTNCTHWAGLMSLWVKAGFGNRNLVSFIAGGCVISAALCNRAANFATSYCKKQQKPYNFH